MKIRNLITGDEFRVSRVVSHVSMLAPVYDYDLVVTVLVTHTEAPFDPSVPHVLTWSMGECVVNLEDVMELGDPECVYHAKILTGKVDA